MCHERLEAGDHVDSGDDIQSDVGSDVGGDSGGDFVVDLAGGDGADLGDDVDSSLDTGLNSDISAGSGEDLNSGVSESMDDGADVYADAGKGDGFGDDLNAADGRVENIGDDNSFAGDVGGEYIDASSVDGGDLSGDMREGPVDEPTDGVREETDHESNDGMGDEATDEPIDGAGEEAGDEPTGGSGDGAAEATTDADGSGDAKQPWEYSPEREATFNDAGGLGEKPPEEQVEHVREEPTDSVQGGLDNSGEESRNNDMVDHGAEDDTVSGENDEAIDAKDMPDECGSSFNDRRDITPINNGEWSGERGNSIWRPEVEDVAAQLRSYGVDGIEYRDGFPDFSPVTVYEHQLPEELYRSSDTVQFNHCNEAMANHLGMNPEFADNFDDDQIEAIRQCLRPGGYSWHHNVEHGNMQLVPTRIHQDCRHYGGRNVWGGGTTNRKYLEEKSWEN